MFKTFQIYICEHGELHSIADIQVLPILIQPKNFMVLPMFNCSFDFKHEQRSVKLLWFNSRPWLQYDEAKDLPLCLSTWELIKASCAAKI